MKKFYLLYFWIFTGVAIVFVLLNMFSLISPYYNWEGITGSECMPMTILLGVPVFCSVLAAVAASAIARPPLKKYGIKELVIDSCIVGGMVVISLAVLLKNNLPPGFSPVYFIINVWSGILAGLNVALFRRIVTGKTGEVREEKTEREPVSWGAAFFTIATLFSIILTLWGFLLFEKGWYYNPDDLILTNAVLFGMVSLGCATGYYLTERLWKRSIFGSLVIFVLTLFGFVLGSDLFVYETMSGATWNLDFQVSEFSSQTPATDDYEEDYYEYYDDYNYDEEDYDQTDDLCNESFACIVRDGEDEMELVGDALEFAAEYMPLNSFPAWVPLDLLGFHMRVSDMYDQTEQTESYHRVTKHLYEKTRTMVISNLVDRYGHLITRIIPRREFRDKAYETFVDHLIDSYEDLFDDNEGDWKCERILEVMNRPYECDWYEWEEWYFDRIADYISDKHLRRYRTSDRQLDVPTVVWVYSFWARRWEQTPANPGDIYQALLKIKALYE